MPQGNAGNVRGLSGRGHNSVMRRKSCTLGARVAAEALAPQPVVAPQNRADLLQPRRDIPLVAVAGRLVVPGADQFVGEVLLGRDSEIRVVRILVALAVPEACRARVVRVAQR